MTKDSYVWKVETAGKEYALKMFRFSSLEYSLSQPAKHLRRPLACSQFYLDYFDPFSCECRVYGRLKNAGREDLAVKAHGYLFLTPEQEMEMTWTLADRECDPQDPEAEPVGNEVWSRCEEHRGQPIRAIVKELVTADGQGQDCGKSFSLAQIPHIWADLKDMHALGILVRDIHSGNYLRGKLVDFSRAWTMYHPCLEHIDKYDIWRFRRRDPGQLEDMFLDEDPLADVDVSI